MKTDILSRFSYPGSALQLALFRIGTGIIIFYTASSRIFELLPLVEAKLSHPTYFPAFLDELIAGPLLAGLVLATQILAVFLIFGLFTRVILPLLTVSFILLFSYYWAALGYPVTWVYFWFPLIILSFSPCADRLSLDRMILKKRAIARDSQSYRWPIEIFVAWFCFIYFAAAFAKLFPLEKGVRWLEGGSIKNLMYSRFLDSPLHFIFNEPLFDYASAYWIFVILAFIAIFSETIVAVILFTDRWHFVILLLVMGMHSFLVMIGLSGFFFQAAVLGIALIPPKYFPDFSASSRVIEY